MRRAHDRLARALVARGGGTTRLAADEQHDWASATFVGARHRLVLEGDGIERLCAGLEEAEFAIPGHIVADIAVVAKASGTATIEALTVEAW